MAVAADTNALPDEEGWEDPAARAATAVAGSSEPSTDRLACDYYTRARVALEAHGRFTCSCEIEKDSTAARCEEHDARRGFRCIDRVGCDRLTDLRNSMPIEDAHRELDATKTTTWPDGFI